MPHCTGKLKMRSSRKRRCKHGKLKRPTKRRKCKKRRRSRKHKMKKAVVTFEGNI